MVFYTALKHSILLCLFLCGVTTIYFATKKASEQQKWLLLTLVCSFVTVLEYFQEIRATNLAMMSSAIKVGHSFKVLTTLSFLQFVSKYCRIKLPKAVQYSFVVMNSIVIASILSFDQHRFFYTFYRVSLYKTIIPYIVIKPGMMYFFFVYGLAATMLVSLYLLFKRMRKAHDKEKTRLIYLIVAGSLPILSVFVQKAAGLEVIDLVPIGFGLSSLILLVVVKKYGLLDVVLSAKESIVENTKDGIIVVDDEYNVLYVNPAMMELRPSIDHQMSPAEKQKLQEMFENPESVQTLEGGVYEIRVSDIYENKIKRGKMAWIFDMSFINSYTKEIMQLKEEAEQANQAKTTFLANMSHEIRTPMNAILGFAELILQKSVKEEIRDHAYDIKHSAENLLHIINEILDISKIESGKQEIVSEEYYTQSLLEDVMVIIENQTREKNLDFTSDIDENIPYKLSGALVQIREILINVLNNAVKYTQDGGVTLKSKFVMDEKQENHGSFCFQIIDTGIGMKEEDVAQIYNRFQKFDEMKNRGIEGTGLGMYIVKSLLNRMEGTIDIESIYGEGTTITIRIPQEVIDVSPIGKMELKFREENQNDTDGFTTTAKILVVDDNEVNLKVVAGLLNRYEIHPDTAPDGYKAIQMIQESQYDLIFLDHMMPGMDGVETLQAIRKLETGNCKTVPIVLLTANAIAGVKEKMLSLGFNGYLSKPIDIAKMEKILLKLLPEDRVTILKYQGVNNNDWEKVVSRTGNVMRHVEVDVGLRNCGGSFLDYMDVLGIVEKYGNERISQLEQMLREKDYTNYTIYVHAIKSTAFNIGAMELGHMAQALEDAGKKKEYAFLEERSPELCLLYHAVLMEIRRFFVLKKNTDKMMEQGKEHNFSELQKAIIQYERLKEKREVYSQSDVTDFEKNVDDQDHEGTEDNGMSSGELMEILSNVKELMDRFEQEHAIQVLQELNQIVTKDEMKEFIQQTISALMNFDMEKASESLNQAIAYICE